jgi:DNA-binding transcriptional LysR family regulator
MPEEQPRDSCQAGEQRAREDEQRDPGGQVLRGDAEADDGDGQAEIRGQEQAGQRLAAGLQRAVRFEVTDYKTAEDMVRNGLGVVLMPASAAEGVTGLPRLAVTGVPLIWKVFVAVASTRRLSAAARALLADLTVASGRPENASGQPGAAGQPGASAIKVMLSPGD